MNGQVDDTVIVRGMTQEWLMDHFKEMAVYFGGDPKAVPARDANFIGFYLAAPESAITHVGIVESIKRTNQGATFYLKAIIKLDEPVSTDHGIRKQEYWTLSSLGIKQVALVFNKFAVAGCY